jgi:hypothetical protein
MLKSDPEKVREWQQRSRRALPKRTKKTNHRMAKAKPMYKARFAEHPTCEVPGCWRPSTDPHHHTTLKRNGEGLYRFRCICGVHHHEFHFVLPKQARANGFVDCLTEDDWGKKDGGRSA